MTGSFCSRSTFAVLVVAALAVSEGCNRDRATATSDGRVAAMLEQCDPAGFVPCIPQVAFASVALPGTGLYLTYSSQWAPGVSLRRPSDVGSLGLGGWSISPLERYDPSRRMLLSGDGSWRETDAVTLPSGERVVPRYDGRVVYIFDSAGRHVRTVDGRLGTVLVQVSYDSAGRLSSVDGSLEGEPVHVSVQRATDGAVRSVTGTDGAITQVSLDGRGRISSLTNPGGGTTRITWDSAGSVMSTTDPTGATTRFTYDPAGHLASTTDADGVAQRFERDASGNSLDIRGSTTMGRTWSSHVELVGGGIRRSFTGTNGTTSNETLDGQGARQVVLADGTRISAGAHPSPSWGMNAPILTPVIRTRSDGVKLRTDVNYALTSVGGVPYTLAGSITTNINGKLWKERIDPSQRTISLIDPAGRSTISTYDSAGRLTAHVAPGSSALSIVYGVNGRISAETSGKGKFARTTRYAYDARIGQLAVTQPDGAVRLVGVNDAGREVRSSVANHSIVTSAFDAASHLIQVTPAGGMIFTLGSSAAGRPTAFLPPPVRGDSSLEAAAYDSDGALVSLVGPGRRSIKLRYDPAGRIRAWDFDRGERALSYDAKTGLRRRSADPSGVVTTYGYVGSTLARLAWSGAFTGSVSEAIDAEGQTTAETVDDANEMKFAYDGSGYVVAIGPMSLIRDAGTGDVTHTKLGVVETASQLDESGRVIRSTATVGGKSVFDLQYARDAMGRIRSARETGADGRTKDTEYAYDSEGALSGVVVDGHTVERDILDPAGNRIVATGPMGAVRGTYDDRNRSTAWGQRKYSWAADGNLTRLADGQNSTSYDYDDFGALRGVTLPDARQISYLVDGDGRRVLRRVGGKVVAGYLYRPDGNVVAETDSLGRVKARFGYDDAGHIALLIRDGAVYRVLTDAVGSPMLVVDSRTGGIADEVAYDAWGRVTHETVSNFMPFGFAGGLRDQDTGLLRFGARDYEAATGRWTAADPLRFASGDANLYRYAAGDPVNHVDPRGTCVGAVDEVMLAPSVFYSRLSREGQCPPDPPSPGNNPPPGNPPPGNPPPGNPPPGPPSNNGGNNWGCQGIYCAPQPGAGCMFGSCHRNPFGFTCDAVFCAGPGGNWCFYCSMGDPHLRAGNGSQFDLQDEGEFIVAMSRDGRHVVQARQEPYFAGAPVTVNTAVAVNVDGDRVGVYAAEPEFLLINDAPAAQLELERRLPHGGSIERRGGSVAIRWPDDSRLNVTRIGHTLNYNFAPAAGVGAVTGLLGGGAEGSTRALTGRDGVELRLSDPSFATKLYSPFADSWRVKSSESLFHYWPGETTKAFSTATPTVGAHAVSQVTRDSAQSVCRAVGVRSQPMLDDCVLDVSVTGVAAIAVGAVALQAASHGAADHVSTASTPSSTLHSGPAIRAQTPGPPTAPDQFAISIGSTVSPDHPTTGAGIITRPGQTQTYSFAGTKGQVVYVAAGPCEGADPSFELASPRDSLIALVIGNCHADIGRVTLPQTGTYHVTASLVNKTDVSRYGFHVHTVPPDQRFGVRLPLLASPDHPMRGAGRIAVEGAQQFYDFTAAAGAVVHVENHCKTCQHLSIRVARVGDRSSSGFVDMLSLNSDWKLPTGGTYTIQVRSDGFVGPYDFSASRTASQNR